MHDAKLVFGHVVMGCRHTVPAGRFDQAPFYALALFVHGGDIVLGLGILLFRRQPVPVDCRLETGRDAPALVEKKTHMILGAGMPLFGERSEDRHGAGVILPLRRVQPLLITLPEDRHAGEQEKK